MPTGDSERRMVRVVEGHRHGGRVGHLMVDTRNEVWVGFGWSEGAWILRRLVEPIDGAGPLAVPDPPEPKLPPARVREQVRG